MHTPITHLLALWGTLPAIIRTVVWILIISIAVILCVAFLTLWERKVIGWMQVRIGPNRVGPWGLIQPIADGVKLLLKEIIVPTKSNTWIFLMAPGLAIGPALACWAVVPFTENLVAANINASLLYIMAISSMGVYGIILAGWASNSKYAFLGAMRSAAQIVSYEIAMGFALVGVLMASQSLNLNEIIMGQAGRFGALNWFFIPLFPLFLTYLISGVAETNRAPFDVAEGESEIVAGFHVEYSGMTFAVFFLAEYANMWLIAALTSVMFFGGWLSPFPESWGLIGKPSIGWMLGKMVFVVTLFLWFRTTFPRYRYDQIMRLGWKVFIPVTLVWIVVLGVWMQTPLWVWSRVAS